MTSVGSVSIDLRLNTAHFDRQLTALESRQLKPLAIDARLDTSALQRDLQRLSTRKVAVGVSAVLDTKQITHSLQSLRARPQSLAVELHVSKTAFERQIKELQRSPIALPVELIPNIEGLRRRLRDSLRSMEIPVTVRPDVTGPRGAAQQANRTSTVVQPRVDTAQAESALTRLRNATTNTLREINQGIGQGIGQGIYNTITGAVTNSAAAMVAFGKQSLDAASKVQNFDIALTTITGSSQGAARETEVFRKVVDDLSLPLEASRRGFLQLAAAANDTSLEGSGVRNIFDGVSHAVSGLNLPAGQADRAFTAISQVMGKGKVTAEEL